MIARSQKFVIIKIAGGKSAGKDREKHDSDKRYKFRGNREWSIVKAVGLAFVIIIGSYLLKYFRGPLSLEEVYGTEQVKNEYMTIHIQYVLDTFMETYKTRNGVRSKSDTYYLILDQDLGAIPVRASQSRNKELERIMEETWDYIKGTRAEPPREISVTGTMKQLDGDGEKYYQKTLNYYDLEGHGEDFYLWAGLLDNQTPQSAMVMTAFGAAIVCRGLFILSRLLKKGHLTSIQSFLDSHPSVTREDLEADFQSAGKLINQFWIGRYFTYGAYTNPEILSNDEITRAWFDLRRAGRNSYPELVCFTGDGKEHRFSMNEKKADQAIKQYQALNPEFAGKMGLHSRALLNGSQDENES